MYNDVIPTEVIKLDEEKMHSLPPISFISTVRRPVISPFSRFTPNFTLNFGQSGSFFSKGFVILYHLIDCLEALFKLKNTYCLQKTPTFKYKKNGSFQ